MNNGAHPYPMSTQSMPAGWPHNVTAVQNSAFASPDPTGMHTFDPSVLDANSNPYQQQQTQQQPQHQPQMPNGTSRHSSPGFQGPQYSVNPVVPLKRPRPREDSVNISPRNSPQGLPNSRSQTPISQNSQLAYQVYQNNQSQQPRPQYANYPPHLQQGSANASPSPVMQDQQFNPQNNSAPKRVATASPSPFSPAPSQQSFMPQVSPPPQSNTPQPQNVNGMAMPPQLAFSQPYTQGFQSPAPTASASPGPIPQPHMAQNPQMNAQMYAMQRQQQQAKLQQQQFQQRMMQQQQQQQQQHAAQMQGMANAMDPNMMAQAQMQRQTQDMQQRQQNDPSNFLKVLYDFLNKRGTPLMQHPTVGGKQISLYNLWVAVFRSGGSARVTREQRWNQVGATLGYPPEHYPMAGEEIAAVFKQVLGAYEENYIRTQQQRKLMQQQQQQQQAQHNQVQAHQQALAMQQAQARMQAQQQNPQMTMQQRPPMNGAIGMQTPQRPPSVAGRPPMPLQGTPVRPVSVNGYVQQQPPTPRQQVHQVPPSTPVRAPVDPQAIPPQMMPGYPAGVRPVMPVIDPTASSPAAPVLSNEYQPKVRYLKEYGGLDPTIMRRLGDELSVFRPSAPSYTELGTIDIHALTMMMKSGISAEIRVALDTLATVTVENRQILSLESCEDLLETLIDVAEYQVQFLGEHAPDGGEKVDMMTYEDVLRACRKEQKSLRDSPKFGTIEYDLDHATDRLLCVTTILRNMSFYETNHRSLTKEHVIRFLSSVIESTGTCSLFLRNYTNLLDFMKDMIVYLSNVAHEIVLPSDEEALNLLHLILAFAPQPSPYQTGRDALMFPPYQPAVHRYLPLAVDTLAKLLARDEPNRAFFRTIYLSESNTSPPYDLLTRSFGISVSTIPENTRTMQLAVDARKPLLEQALMAAEILAGICPGPETGLAKAWSSSEDGFSMSLLRVVCLLCMEQPTPQMKRGQVPTQDDKYPFWRITHRGLALLKKLVEKSDSEFDGIPGGVPWTMFPKKESMLGALMTPTIDRGILNELCSYAGLN